MKRTILLAALAAAVGCAQAGPPPARPVARQVAKTAAPAPAVAVSAAKVIITRQTFKTLEDGFNLKLTTFNPGDAVYMLGLTRGVYLQGYGVVFSTELDLVQSPTINPFHQQILPEEVAATHARKVKQLPLLRKAVLEQMMTCAKNLDAVPASEQIVMVVRLDYQAWEKMAGLPSQILLRADRKSAAAGDIQVEDQ
jgi:hypothetical protein